MEIFDEFHERMVNGVVETLRPFLVSDDQFSRMLFHTLKRIMARASTDDLIQVLIGARDFCDEMEPYKDEYYRIQTEALDPGRSDAGSGTGDGPGGNGRDDTFGEIDLTSVDSKELFETLSVITGGQVSEADFHAAMSHIDSRYEAPVAGDMGTDGTIPPQSIPELREGGHAGSSDLVESQGLETGVGPTVQPDGNSDSTEVGH